MGKLNIKNGPVNDGNKDLFVLVDQKRFKRRELLQRLVNQHYSPGIRDCLMVLAF